MSWEQLIPCFKFSLKGSLGQRGSCALAMGAKWWPFEIYNDSTVVWCATSWADIQLGWIQAATSESVELHRFTPAEVLAVPSQWHLVGTDKSVLSQCQWASLGTLLSVHVWSYLCMDCCHAFLHSCYMARLRWRAYLNSGWSDCSAVGGCYNLGWHEVPHSRG